MSTGITKGFHDRAENHLSRRSFVNRSAAAAGAFAGWSFLKPVLGETKIAPSDRLAAAIIGAGGMASFHAGHQLAPHFHIEAVCDVDQSRAKSFNDQFCSGKASVTSSYQELLERSDIDVVFVCTPDHWHTKISIDALRSGKDVYCEKPLTLTIDEGRLIEEAISKSDRILQVGTQQRSDLNFQTAVALAQSGKVGQLKRITVAIGGGAAGGPFQKTKPPKEFDWNTWLGQAAWTKYIPERSHGNFRWWYEYSGGKMTDWGAHHVDIAHWAAGQDDSEIIHIEPLDVKHPVPFKDGMPTVDDCYNTATSFRVRCQLPSGVEVVIRDNANDLGFENGLLFECEAGRFFVNRGKLTGKPIEELEHNPLPEEALAALRKNHAPRSHTASFYWSCRERCTPISDVRSHMQSLSICHLANIAMRIGRPLQWDPDSKSIVGDDDAARWLSRPQRKGFEVT